MLDQNSSVEKSRSGKKFFDAGIKKCFDQSEVLISYQTNKVSMIKMLKEKCDVKVQFKRARWS